MQITMHFYTAMKFQMHRVNNSWLQKFYISLSRDWKRCNRAESGVFSSEISNSYVSSGAGTVTWPEIEKSINATIVRNVTSRTERVSFEPRDKFQRIFLKKYWNLRQVPHGFFSRDRSEWRWAPPKKTFLHCTKFGSNTFGGEDVWNVKSGLM